MRKSFSVISSTIIAATLLTSSSVYATHKDYKDEAKTYHFMDGISGTMGLYTNYIFRGNSQSTNLPAVQGGINYTFPIGFYLSLWASNVKFTDTTASVEVDTGVGYANQIGDNFTYNLSYVRYNYPGATILEYNEFLAVLNFYFLQAGLGYSGNVYNSHKSGTYYNGGINYNIPPKYVFNMNDVNITALIGRYDLPVEASNSYTDYSVNLTKKIDKTYSASLIWTATNKRNPPYDRNQVVGAIAAAF